MSTVTLKAQSEASVPTPAGGSNEQKLFLNSDNANLLSTKDEAGTVTPSGVGTATELATSGASVDVAAAAPPTTGQLLTAVNATSASWQAAPVSALTVTTVKVAGYTAVVNDLVRVDVSGGNVQIDLPAGHAAGDKITVKLVTVATPTTNECVVDADAGEFIDGALTVTLDTNYEWITLVSDGTNWMQVG